jgi:hypothetical protein
LNREKNTRGFGHRDVEKAAAKLASYETRCVLREFFSKVTIANCADYGRQSPLSVSRAPMMHPNLAGGRYANAPDEGYFHPISGRRQTLPGAGLRVWVDTVTASRRFAKQSMSWPRRCDVSNMLFV